MGLVQSGYDSSELTHISGTFVRAEDNIRPLRDQIIVEPLPVEHSTTLEVLEFTKPLRGIVKAVGPGHYPKMYNHSDKHKRTKMWDSKHFQPTQVKVGDIVELGSLYHNGRVMGYSFQEFMWGNKKHIICREADVSGIVEQ